MSLAEELKEKQQRMHRNLLVEQYRESQKSLTTKLAKQQTDLSKKMEREIRAMETRLFSRLRIWILGISCAATLIVLLAGFALWSKFTDQSLKTRPTSPMASSSR